MSRVLAIIGTAGRDKAQQMDSHLWRAMVDDACSRVHPDDELVSGGAAWADHLAVTLFLDAKVSGLKLFLPAPLTLSPSNQWCFESRGPRSSGGAANYYHDKFALALGYPTMEQIAQAILTGASVHAQPAAAGFGGMFARNKLVAQAANAALAYTFGAGAEPADGGTRNTWDQIESADKTHVDLQQLRARCTEAAAADPAPSVTRAQRYGRA